MAALALSVLLAGLTAAVVVRIDNSGVFVRSTELLAPPAAITSLAVAGVGDVVAELASGLVYLLLSSLAAIVWLRRTERSRC